MNDDRAAIEGIAHAIEAGGIDVASRDEYDLDTILSETHEFNTALGYVQIATEEEFWASVERNAKEGHGD